MARSSTHWRVLHSASTTTVPASSDGGCGFVGLGWVCRVSHPIHDLVEDIDRWNQRVTPQPDQFRRESAGVVGLGQPGDPLRGGGERDPVTGLAGPDRDADR
jgi:hypothetical protein